MNSQEDVGACAAFLESVVLGDTTREARVRAEALEFRASLCQVAPFLCAPTPVGGNAACADQVQQHVNNAFRRETHARALRHEALQGLEQNGLVARDVAEAIQHDVASRSERAAAWEAAARRAADSLLRTWNKMQADVATSTRRSFQTSAADAERAEIADPAVCDSADTEATARALRADTNDNDTRRQASERVRRAFDVSLAVLPPSARDAIDPDMRVLGDANHSARGLRWTRSCEGRSERASRACAAFSLALWGVELTAVFDADGIVDIDRAASVLSVRGAANGCSASFVASAHALLAQAGVWRPPLVHDARAMLHRRWRHVLGDCFPPHRAFRRENGRASCLTCLQSWTETDAPAFDANAGIVHAARATGAPPASAAASHVSPSTALTLRRRDALARACSGGVAVHDVFTKSRVCASARLSSIMAPKQYATWAAAQSTRLWDRADYAALLRTSRRAAPGMSTSLRASASAPVQPWDTCTCLDLAPALCQVPASACVFGKDGLALTRLGERGANALAARPVATACTDGDGALDDGAAAADERHEPAASLHSAVEACAAASDADATDAAVGPSAFLLFLAYMSTLLGPPTKHWAPTPTSCTGLSVGEASRARPTSASAAAAASALGWARVGWKNDTQTRAVVVLPMPGAAS